MTEVVAANALTDDAVGLPLTIRLRQETTCAIGPLLRRDALIAAPPALRLLSPARLLSWRLPAARPNAVSLPVGASEVPDRPPRHVVARLIVSDVRAVHVDASERLPRRAGTAIGVVPHTIATRQATTTEGQTLVYTLSIWLSTASARPIAEALASAYGRQTIVTRRTSTGPTTGPSCKVLLLSL